MHTWSQNLNEYGGKVVGSKFWHGRGHISAKPFEGIKLGAEWLFFHKVRWDFALTLETGHSDADDGFMFHFSLPWLCSIFIYLDGICRVKQSRRFNLSIHDDAIYFYPWSKTMETNARDPWWVRGWSWGFPWSREWVYTRVLSHDGKQIVSEERHPHRRDFFGTWDERQKVQESVSVDYSYRYVRKNGEVQLRMATVYVDEMAWGFKWLRRPFFVRRSINVRFDQEVGEKTGSWKGGCTGCGYDMKPGESALDCLRRMEAERTFR